MRSGAGLPDHAIGSATPSFFASTILNGVSMSRSSGWTLDGDGTTALAMSAAAAHMNAINEKKQEGKLYLCVACISGGYFMRVQCTTLNDSHWYSRDDKPARISRSLSFRRLCTRLS